MVLLLSKYPKGKYRYKAYKSSAEGSHTQSSTKAQQKLCTKLRTKLCIRRLYTKLCV